MKAKFLGIAIAFAMVSMAFAAFPAAAADPQSVRSRTWDYAVAEDSQYHDLAGDEGWSMYWYDETAKGIYRGNPADSVSYTWGGAFPNSLVAPTWAMDNLYTDPGGWLYNNPVLAMNENPAAGLLAFSYTADSTAGSPYDMPYVKMQPVPVPTGAINGADIDLTWTDFVQVDDADTPVGSPIQDQLIGYEVFRSTSNVNWNDNAAEGPVGNPAAWTSVSGTIAAGTQAFTDTGIITGSGNTYYYSLKMTFYGESAPGTPVEVDSKYGGLQSIGILDPGGNTPPVVQSFSAEVGTLLAGDHTAPTVTLEAVIDDVVNEGDPIASAEINVNGEGWVGMSLVTAGGTATETYDYLYTAPAGYYPTGVINYEVRGYDDQGGPGAVSGDSFTITDTTDPTLAWNTVPAATIFTTQPANFQIGYEDFTAYDGAPADPNLVTCFLRWQVNGLGYSSYQLVNNTGMFSWGSFVNGLDYSIPGSTFVAGDVIDYDATLQDGGGNSLLLAGGSFTVLEAPAGVQDPYPVYGYLDLYDGIGGVYTPMRSGGGAVVTATWISNFDGSTLFRTDTTNVLGQYSIDLLNYTDGANVHLTATFDAPYSNNGYNITQIIVAAGSSFQNVLCGIPIDVQITAPAPLASYAPGAPIATTYVWYDCDGAVAQGYFTHADGPMIWWSLDPLFVAPAAYNFDGIVGGDFGTHNDVLQLWTGPQQFINISENGAAGINSFATPWGAISIPHDYDAVGVVGYWQNFTSMVGGEYEWKDWDNITLNVQVGGFDWDVVVGWNIVSVPQDPVNKGAIAGFDSFDALEYCAWQLIGVTDLALYDRTGPSTYTPFNYGQAEGVSFPMDMGPGYWVYSDVAGICHFNATNYTTSVDDGSGNWVLQYAIGAGWNLVGIMHNYTVVPYVITASDFTDTTVDLDLDTAGAAGPKVIATEWLEDAAPQWYHSYVEVDIVFPGMATHDWVMEPFSINPGTGLFLWVDAGVTIDWDTDF